MALTCVMQFLKHHELHKKLHYATDETHEIAKPGSTSSKTEESTCTNKAIYCCL